MAVQIEPRLSSIDFNEALYTKDTAVANIYDVIDALVSDITNNKNINIMNGVS